MVKRLHAPKTIELLDAEVEEVMAERDEACAKTITWETEDGEVFEWRMFDRGRLN